MMLTKKQLREAKRGRIAAALWFGFYRRSRMMIRYGEGGPNAPRPVGFRRSRDAQA